MSDTSSKQVAPYGLRMAPELKERVAASADRNSRSMNVEINHALEEYLSHHDQRAAGCQWVQPSHQIEQEQLEAIEYYAHELGLKAKSIIFTAIEAQLKRLKQMEIDKNLSSAMKAAGESEDVYQYSLATDGSHSAKLVRLSEPDLKEIKETISATVAKELVRLLGRQ